MKIGVVSPARDMVNTGYAFDAMNMLAFTAATRPDITLASYTSLGTMIFDQRIKLAREAMEEGCDYVLWLDSDMRFPKDTMLRLLRHQRDIVGANYVSRQVPPEPVSFILTKDGSKWCRVPTLRESTGLEQVSGCGFGVTLTSAKVLKKLDEDRDKPMFWFQYSVKNHTVLGEDIYFCINATHHGFDIWIDHDLSKEVRHIGSFEFGHEHVDDMVAQELRKAVDAEQRANLNEDVPMVEAAE